ncbi:MarR family winged helix-turn-helix transcriptional regulator [uncultured Friedmanniella sp.]|uniref:MarR family winged helix-turn-helix transcriptional regulator n=1 Tax=uncultured Friedmanniella sp. TaxID=335381 RepID=UPI0035CA29EE
MQTTLTGRRAPADSSEGSADASSVVDSVLHALLSVGRLMRQPIDGDALDPSTFWLLKTVGHQGPMRVTELAGTSHLDTSTVSRHVAQLDRAGLVERTPDPADRRAHRIGLSPEGREALDNAYHRRRTLLSRGIGTWDAADVAQLDHLLGRFVNDVENLTADLEQA